MPVIGGPVPQQQSLADTRWHYVGMPNEPALTFGAPYETPATNYGWPRFRKDPEGCVWIEGLMTGLTGITAGSLFFTLPPGYRPNYYLIFFAEGSGSAVEIQVAPSGAVTYVAAQVTPGHLAFDNISFMAEDLNPPAWQTLTLSNGWTNYFGNNAPARVYVDSCGDAHFSGLVAGGAVGTICAALPAGSYDTVGSYTRLQSAWSNAGMCRIDITSAGVMSLIGYGTGGSNASVSLDNIVIPNIGGYWGGKTDFVNSWANYGSTYAPMAITVNKNGIASLRGLIRFGTAATITSAAINPLYMPTHQKIFISGANANKSCRIDVVNANGLLSLVGYYDGGANGYVSLDTMRWNTQFAK
jgi:hypothetical protein